MLCIMVFNRFLFGFPPNWESYAKDCFREESATGIDSGVEKSIPTSVVSPEEASGDHEKPLPGDECNASREMGGVNVNVVYSSGGNRRSARLHNSKVCKQKKQPASGSPLKHTGKGKTSASEAFENPDGEGLKSPVTPVQSQSKGQLNMRSEQVVKKSASRISLVTPEQPLGNHEKPFYEDECNVSKEMGGVNVGDASGGNRRSTRLRNIKVCQLKNKPVSGGPLKHPDKEKSSTSGALQNPGREGLESPVTPIESQSQQQVNTSSEQLVKKSATRISLASPEEASGDRGKPFLEDESNASKDIGGVNHADGSGGYRRSTRLRNSKVCQPKNKPTSGCHPKHPDKEHGSTSRALENPDGLKNPVIMVESQSHGQVNTSSEQLVKKFASRISLVPPEEPLGDHGKPFPLDERNASEEMDEVNDTDGNGGIRRSARLHNIKVCQQKKKPASGGPPKHPDKEQSCTSGALEIPDGEGLKSPVTPIQSQSQSQGLVNPSSEQLVKKSASRISRPLFANTEGRYKKKTAIVETKATGLKRKMSESASAVKYPRERDGSPVIKGGKQEISSVTPKSLSFRKSRSGRLLLPPLEFWRNQIPVYNPDREITEIQEGASLESPFKGSSPLLNRSKKQKPAA